MITLSSLSIGPRAMAAPKWWPPAAQPNWPELDAKIAEMERQVRQYPPKRKEPSMSPTTKINTTAIYAARNRIHNTLDGDDQARVQEARDLVAEVLAGALSPDARTALEQARDKLNTALGESTLAEAAWTPGPGSALAAAQRISETNRHGIEWLRNYHASKEGAR